MKVQRRRHIIFVLCSTKATRKKQTMLRRYRKRWHSDQQRGKQLKILVVDAHPFIKKLWSFLRQPQHAQDTNVPQRGKVFIDRAKNVSRPLETLGRCANGDANIHRFANTAHHLCEAKHIPVARSQYYHTHAPNVWKMFWLAVSFVAKSYFFTLVVRTNRQTSTTLCAFRQRHTQPNERIRM